MIRKLLTFLADIFFPPRCIICHKLMDSSRDPVCSYCLEHLPEYDGAEPRIRFSEQCIVSFYYEQTFRESFLRYKFADRREYAAQYGKWMCVAIRDKLKIKPDVITFVPVSKKRRRERGYDQAELLAKTVSEILQVPCVPLLEKQRHTKPQSGLRNKAERAANASNAYRICDPSAVDAKQILLIDDIITTGATMSECCRMLLLAGAKSVCCAALATPRESEER